MFEFEQFEHFKSVSRCFKLSRQVTLLEVSAPAPETDDEMEDAWIHESISQLCICTSLTSLISLLRFFSHALTIG